VETIQRAARPAEPPRAAKAEPVPIEKAEPPVAAKKGEGETPTAVSKAATEAAELNPDMVVQMEGMEPMRAADLLKRIKEEAAEDIQEGDFVQAAVACLLRN
jgi:hypothetical protein